MDFKKRGNKLVAAALCAALVFTMNGAFPVGAAKTTDERKLEDQIANYEKILNEKANDISQKEEYNKTLDAQIAVMNEKIDADQAKINALNNEISAKNAQIAELEAQINAKQEDIDAKNADIANKEEEKQKTVDQLKERIRASYMAGQTSTLEMLLSSEDFGKFLSNYEYMKRITTHDRKLAETYMRQVQELETARAEVEQAKSEQEDERASMQQSIQEVETKKAELTETQQGQQATRSSLQQKLKDNNRELGQMNQEYEASLEELKSMQADLEQMSRESMNSTPPANSSSNTNSGGNTGGDSSNNGSSGGNNSGGSNNDNTSSQPSGGGNNGNNNSGNSNSYGFVWPVPGHTYISQGYKGLAHTGIDIPAPVNTPIVAVKAGVVKEAYPNGRTDGNGWWTYGKYLIIDHGNGELSLYAHCNSLNVSVGQQVSQGQKIAGVGNTGNSFGNHLHIELYRNGGRVDPQSYLR